MCSKPSVSVVIPAYNSQSTVRRALESVLSQTLQPIEIIVVDDGSVDETVSIVKELARHLSPGFLEIVELHSNHGPGYARNVGWDMASGEFLAFLDADDSWHPRKLEIQAAYMLIHNELTLTSHRSICLTEHDKPDVLPKDWSVKPILSWQLLVSYQFTTPSVMLKRKIPYRFDPFRYHSEDRLLWLRIVLNGYKAARLELPLGYQYKAPWGEAGLSSHLWEAEKDELDTYAQLRKMRLLNKVEESALKVFSLLKYLRRLWISWRRSRAA